MLGSRRHTRRAIAVASVSAAVLAAGVLPATGATGFGSARRSVESVCRTYARLDRDGDGNREINDLRVIDSARGTNQGVVIILVESRLLMRPSDERLGLAPALRRFARDIAADGFHAIVVSADLYGGPMHQDGLTVLAIRDVLRGVWRMAPDLRAAVMVGNFPDAFMVRQYYWPRSDALSLDDGSGAPRSWKAVAHVRSLAEPVASPADIILADLDGHWDKAYRKGPERLAGLLAAFPDDPKRAVTNAWQYTADPFEDFFLVQDGTWEEGTLPGGQRRFSFAGEPNSECSLRDVSQANIIAKPEISIGRINAKRAGVQPDPAIRGVRNEGLLTPDGVPQTVEFASAKGVPDPDRIWTPSEALERRLLLQYFDRNHRYRTGGFASARKPASIATEWGSSVPEMAAAVRAWAGLGTGELDVNGAEVTSVDLVNWLKRPALARSIKAHSSGTGFGLSAPRTASELQAAVGPQAWWWTKQGPKLVPNLAPLGGWVNYGILRSLYENRALSGSPALYFHTGCEIIMPRYYEHEPYISPNYGQLQAAEALLMLADGLALVGRGKVFYDEPREFWREMGHGATFGDAWRHYFTVEAADSELAKDGIGRKRAYFWSMIGDPTLRLPPDLIAPKTL